MATITRKINPEALKRLQRATKDLEGKVGKAGWFETAKYENGMPVANIAAGNEYGVPAKNIPPRPVARPAATEIKKTWRTVAGSAIKGIINGGETIGTVMEKLSSFAAGTMRKNITELYSPKLADATIYARVHRTASRELTMSITKPLVDHGIMLNTVSNVVEDK